MESIHIFTDFDTVISPEDFYCIQLTSEQHTKLVESDYDWSALEGEVVEVRENAHSDPCEVLQILVPTPFNRRLLEANIQMMMH